MMVDSQGIVMSGTDLAILGELALGSNNSKINNGSQPLAKVSKFVRI
jgi:hypothetical protein